MDGWAGILPVSCTPTYRVVTEYLGGTPRTPRVLGPSSPLRRPRRHTRPPTVTVNSVSLAGSKTKDIYPRYRCVLYFYSTLLRSRGRGAGRESKERGGARHKPRKDVDSKKKRIDRPTEKFKGSESNQKVTENWYREILCVCVYVRVYRVNETTRILQRGTEQSRLGVSVGP